MMNGECVSDKEKNQTPNRETEKNETTHTHMWSLCSVQFENGHGTHRTKKKW